ncbi:N-acetyl-D-glucosamine ABC transport system [Halalkalibacter hemicellulosilyticusJCM 9152]|uniref:N-acetyl-D-glucosamine ABC transport system n=2 Tax=Halalkalibacter TaxID=2893056 RepID=W4QLE3_9BACI|nr:N-acetyl-D-glucosamine ABC transport system [Halalkalibacter hemicellulosilyticusJCM 9152]
MYMMKKKYVRVIFVLVLFISLISVYNYLNSKDGEYIQVMADFEAITDETSEEGYDQYLNQHLNADRPDEIVRVEGEDYVKTSGEGFEIVEQYEGLDGHAVLTPEEGTISWDVHIEHPGLYNVRVHYYPMEGKSSSIEREFSINGEIPFDGAEILLFDRLWDNLLEEILTDDQGNELRPRQVERPEWTMKTFMDSEGYYDEPFLFYFPEGNQQISLTSLREPMAIDYIELYQESDAKPYDEVKRQYEEEGIEPTTGQFIKVQAEDAVRKSSPTLYPLTDRSSPLVEPYHVSNLRINTIGGFNWKQPGQWIEWEVEVEEDGLYHIGLKQKQDLLRGIYSTRSLTINGESPFEEMNRIRFHYALDWQMDALGGEEPYLFHLTEGTHRIRMMVSLGDVAPLIRTIESSVLQLNEMYRQILMITSNTPDPLRDYQLERRIPHMLDIFTEQAEVIESVAAYLEESTGEKSDKVAVLHSMVRQLEDMVDNPDTIARRLDTYKLNVGGLGTWLQTVREQPLTLDYLVVASPDQELPRAQATFFEKARHEIGAFFASYTEDYDSIGNIEELDRSITVWITTGRDQAQILKSLIDDTFTPESNISVHLRLVPPEILLPATLANEGPDVALQMGEDVPVNYAMRSAAADLSIYEDFDEVSERFRESAILPYRYEGGVYALPETQMFPMLFYRKDILEELELEPPETWEDVYHMISVLQRHNLEFFLPIEDPMAQANQTLVPNAAFSMLLYQNGGEFYQEDLTASALNSEISIDTFNKWTQFYTNYKFPLMADFPNRFRVGEMPIGVADYNTYNMLSVLAPEIRGMWEFTVVPGTEMEDGSIRHDVSSYTTAAVMLENAEDKDASWEFLKWWTDKETQIHFGREMESLLGEAARYPTANIEALEELPWPVEDYNNLDSQWEWVRGIPQVPGGYFTGRHLDNAFRRVVNANENPREALADYIRYINEEIDIKRREFNLSQ